MTMPMSNKTVQQMAKWFAVGNLGGPSRAETRRPSETINDFIDRCYMVCKQDHRDADVEGDPADEEAAYFAKEIRKESDYWQKEFEESFGEGAVQAVAS